MASPDDGLPRGLSVPAGLTFDPGGWLALQRLYARPPRAYHGLDHVAEVLGHWSQVDAEGAWGTLRAETWLAVLLHDAVYEPGKPDNEERSADLVRGFLAAWGPVDAVGDRPDVGATEALIRLTARHGRLKPAEVSTEQALFLDCDMAILGAAPDRFDAYDAAIREEYAPVAPPPILARGREQFLLQLLRRSRIFLSDRFHARYDATARANLTRTLGPAAGDGWDGGPESC